MVIYVADQGIGIPENELPHIFERFYRVDSGLRRTTAGSGLGLFLAKAIVDAHGGQIWVRSETGKGTTFFVALPVSAGLDDDVRRVVQEDDQGRNAAQFAPLERDSQALWRPASPASIPAARARRCFPRWVRSRR